MYLSSKKLRLRHDLPILVIDSDSAGVLFSRNFAYVKFRENKTRAKISEFTVFKSKGKLHMGDYRYLKDQPVCYSTSLLGFVLICCMHYSKHYVKKSSKR